MTRLVPLLLAACFSLAAPLLAAEPAAAAPAPPAAPATTWGLSTDHAGNLFTPDEAVTVTVQVPPTLPAAVRPVLALFNVAGDCQRVTWLHPLAPGSRNAVVLSPLPRRYYEVRLLPVDGDDPATALEAQPLATITLALLPTITTPDSRFGLNAPVDQASLARRLGSYWLRQHVPWEQGAADQPIRTTGIERELQTVAAGGCQLFGISSYGLPWATTYAPTDTRPMRAFFSPPRPEAWDAYVRVAARAIKGQVPAFEVWNECNFDMFWRSTPDTPEQRVADYAAMLKRTYAIMKAEAPELQITTGSLVNGGRSPTHAFLQALLDQDCGSSFDILNIHYYHANLAPEEATGKRQALQPFIAGFQEVLGKAKLTQPIWLTEMGWPSQDPGGWPPVTELEQAQFLVRSHVLSLAQGVAVIMWFQLGGKEFALVDATRGPRPAAGAYTQMVAALAGKPFTRRLPAASEDTYVYQFGSDAAPLLVAWSLHRSTWQPPAGLTFTHAQALAGEDLTPPDAPAPTPPPPGTLPPLDLHPGKAIPLGPDPIYLWGIRQP